MASDRGRRLLLFAQAVLVHLLWSLAPGKDFSLSTPDHRQLFRAGNVIDNNWTRMCFLIILHSKYLRSLSLLALAANWPHISKLAISIHNPLINLGLHHWCQIYKSFRQATTHHHRRKITFQVEIYDDNRKLLGH